MSKKHAWGPRSRKLLGGCNPILRDFADELLESMPFDLTILPSTIRTEADQLSFYNKGRSKTLTSKHLVQPYSKAIDVAPWIDGEIDWTWPGFFALGAIGKEIIRKRRVFSNISWGGSWSGFKDRVHWELPWAPGERLDVQRRVEIYVQANAANRDSSE